SSDAGVIRQIESIFKIRLNGSHFLHHNHDNVFRFLVSGNDKIRDLINSIFPSVSTTDDRGQKVNIYKSEAREAYNHLQKYVTLAYIKETNGMDNSLDLAHAETQREILESYFH